MQTRVDPFLAAVIHGALENIAIEMGHKLMRMSYSSIIRESEDFGAALTDATGRQLCECTMCTPLQSGPDPRLYRGHPARTRKARRQRATRRRVHAQRSLCRRLARPRRRFRRSDLPQGQAGRLLGDDRASSRHRRADAGQLRHRRCGRHLCRGPAVQGRPRLRRGQARSTRSGRSCGSNIRIADLVVGDMEAQVAAARIGAERYSELLDQYGLETVTGAYEDLLDYSERLMRDAISAIPDGTLQCANLYRRLSRQ